MEMGMIGGTRCFFPYWFAYERSEALEQLCPRFALGSAPTHNGASATAAVTSWYCPWIVLSVLRSELEDIVWCLVGRHIALS